LLIFVLFFLIFFFFFFQAEDGIRDRTVTGVQTCALPISHASNTSVCGRGRSRRRAAEPSCAHARIRGVGRPAPRRGAPGDHQREIGRASCRERVERAVVGG